MDNSIKKVTSQVRKQMWIKNISDRNASGLSIKSWCTQNGVNETSYYYWLKKIRYDIIEAAQTTEEENLTFVPILKTISDRSVVPFEKTPEAPSSSPNMTITSSNITIDFGTEASQDLILNVLRVLKNA